jgi:glyoxylase-like metal-dependent hydrolase (beta-lactamase superfamily II)
MVVTALVSLCWATHMQRASPQPGDYNNVRYFPNMAYTVRLIAITVWLCTNISTAKPSDGMRVTLLGTGTPFPSAERFGSAILVEVAGKRLLFDCGRGALIRLTQAGVSPKDIDDAFLTHLHSDHVVGIPDLRLSGWFSAATDRFQYGAHQELRA